MKKLFAVLLALVLLVWPGQGRENPAPSGPAGIMTVEETMAALAQTILDSQSDGTDYHLLSGEDTEFYLTRLYGIPADGRERAALIYTVGGVDAREIAVVYVSSSGMEERPAAGLEAYRQNRHNDFFGYEPAQAKLVRDGMVLENGSWSVLLLCTEPSKALTALERAYPELALRPYDAAQEAYDWTAYLDELGYQRFDPPNEVDMTLYDTAAIRAAYVSGDERGLSEKDTAILQKCREALNACIIDGMTDFEKELALHDWLVDHVAYDRSVHDARTPEGQPDNKNPYGALVGGYSICLGYTTTFQLLMDLAGVECITVVGAASNSAQDHAWNMVKLEGEWYCVDLTWDDGTTRTTSAQHHQYFNVTSDYMRQTNHQWDYINVPEATATHFRWDGTGQKPA